MKSNQVLAELAMIDIRKVTTTDKQIYHQQPKWTWSPNHTPLTLANNPINLNLIIHSNKASKE